MFFVIYSYLYIYVITSIYGKNILHERNREFILVGT